MIREILKTDIDAILEIENASFPVPFSRQLFITMTGRQPFRGFLAEESGKIVAYVYITEAADEVEILTIAVKASHRKKRIAKSLIDKVVSEAKIHNVKSIFLEVRPSNENAIKLYSTYGFKQVGVRKNYYTDNQEDALVFILTI